MKKHWKYLNYVVRHKWFVFKACRELRVSLWQALIHDWTKFLPCEWVPYVWSFNGPWKYDSRPRWLVDDFDCAWLHHQQRNPHHWQYWILKQDSGETKVLEMPDKYIREMVADWIGAGRAITGKYEAFDWYQKNKERMQLGRFTRERVERYLSEWDENRKRMIRVLGYYS